MRHLRQPCDFQAKWALKRAAHNADQCKSVPVDGHANAVMPASRAIEDRKGKKPERAQVAERRKERSQGLHFGAERSTSTLEIPRHFSSAAVTMFMLAELFSKLLPS